MLRNGARGGRGLFSGSQQVNIKVGGTSMMARLLRRTFSAFNTSSTVRIVSDNQRESVGGRGSHGAMIGAQMILLRPLSFSLLHRVRDYALLPGRLCVRQRYLLPPAGGALQLPSGLR